VCCSQLVSIPGGGCVPLFSSRNRAGSLPFNSNSAGGGQSDYGRTLQGLPAPSRPHPLGADARGVQALQHLDPNDLPLWAAGVLVQEEISTREEMAILVGGLGPRICSEFLSFQRLNAKCQTYPKSESGSGAVINQQFQIQINHSVCLTSFDLMCSRDSFGGGPQSHHLPHGR